MEQLDICVCTLTYNEIEILPMYYRQIKKFASSWVVIDHGSDDGTIEFLLRKQKKGEMDITLEVSPTPNFHGNFFRELNRVFRKSNRSWTWKGFPDEIPSRNTPQVLKRLIEAPKKVYWVKRAVITNLFPLKIRENKYRPQLWPTEWNLGYNETPGHVHQEDLRFDNKHFPVEKISEIQIYDIGECRNIEKVREKELAYESLGLTILTSKWNEEKRERNIRNSQDFHDGDFINLLV